MQFSGNPVTLYKHIQKVHVKGWENLITTATPFPKPYIFLLQTSLYVKGVQISLFIWPLIFEANEQMHVAILTYTQPSLKHASINMFPLAKFIQSPTGLKGHPAFLPCQHLYRICPYPSHVPILFELLTRIYPKKTHFLRKLHCFSLPNLYKISKTNFMPNQEENHPVTFYLQVCLLFSKLGRWSSPSILLKWFESVN